MLKYYLEVVNVLRDFIQGLYANRIPLDDPRALRIFELTGELADLNTEQLKTGIAEFAGADPQVTVMYRNRDFMEVYRKIREAVPNLVMRPLWRGINAFVLEGNNILDLQHFLQHLADDLADVRDSKLHGELLRVKVFDSQGNMSEIETTIAMIADLREKGHSITAEIAVPFSSGQHYPTMLFIEKALDAARLLKKYNLPLEQSHISLKDMVGEMTPEHVRQLFPVLIRMLRDEGLTVPLGLHLHDTGHAHAAYIQAIKICKDNDYPITIDTVECDPISTDYTGSNRSKNTGFDSLLAIHDELAGSQYDIGLSPEHIEKYKETARLAKSLALDHAPARVNVELDQDDLRLFKIPGGGVTSFTGAVKAAKIRERLQLVDETAAVKLAGYALIAVGNLMGQPFPVTPGFQNKQKAALNFLQNLIDAKLLTADMTFDAMQTRVLKVLENNNDVDRLFLKNLPPVVREFLRGEMPCAMHPHIRSTLGTVEPGTLVETIPSRKKHLKPIPGKVDAETVVDFLFNQGLLKITATQAQKVLCNHLDKADDRQAVMQALIQQGAAYESPDGSRMLWPEQPYNVLYTFYLEKGLTSSIAERKATEITNQLYAKVRQTYITWALELGEPKKLIGAVTQSWLHEPDPRNKEQYAEALQRFQVGKNPMPDRLRKMYGRLRRSKVPIEMMRTHTDSLLREEYKAIQADVMTFIQHATGTLVETVEALYAAQKDIIRKQESNGKYFILSDQQRLQQAKYFLKSVLSDQADEIDAIWQAITDAEVCTSMAGKVLRVTDKTHVQKGDVIAVVEAMKMEHPILATQDGEIAEICVKQDAIIAHGQVVARYKKSSPEQTADAADSRPVINDEALQAQTQPAAEPIIKGLQGTALQRDIINFQTLMTHLKQSGYYAEHITQRLTRDKLKALQNEIHIIDNRAGCAAKLYADLKQAGCKVLLLYTAGDATTPVIENAQADEKLLIDSYMSHETMLNTCETFARQPGNRHKQIYLHPGWGFLSEEAGFVEKMEALGKRYNVRFVGPASEAMSEAGSKIKFRKLAEKLAPKFNPQFITSIDMPELNQQYAAVMAMGGDVVIKADAGGGGRGIQFFRHDKAQSEVENQARFKQIVTANIADSKKLFNNTDYLIEQRAQGKTRHLEIQFGATCKGAMIFGARDCTVQNKGQKVLETNIIQGDYTPEQLKEIYASAEVIINDLAKKGYTGVGTLEMLISDEGTVFLEVNTRVQVEHMVTEDDIRIKTDKNISLPLTNYLFTKHAEEKPEAVLQQHFGVTAKDINAMRIPGKERVVHYRLNSRNIDPTTGQSTPAYFRDQMFNIADEIKHIHEQTQARIIVGGLGAANYDPQVGAICGKQAESLAAAKALLPLVDTAQACYENEGKLSLDFVTEFTSLLFTAKGHLNPDITTKTLDGFLKAIQERKVSIALDFSEPSLNPKMQPNAMKNAFTQFLQLTGNKAPAPVANL